MYYVKRKENMLKVLAEQKQRLSNKVRFILAVISGELVVNNRRKQELLEELHEEGYDLMPKNMKNEADENDEMIPEDGLSVSLSRSLCFWKILF